MKHNRKNYKLDFIEIISVCFSKDTVNSKTQTETNIWENILIKDLCPEYIKDSSNSIKQAKHSN